MMPWQSLNESWEMVRAHLDNNETIGRTEAARLLSVSDVQASRILSALFNDKRRIEPVGKPRGRGVAYRLPSSS